MMAKLTQCDICEKNVKEENSYGIKLRNNDTGLTKPADICADCCKAKGILDILGNIAWKEWNQSGRSWKTPQK